VSQIGDEYRASFQNHAANAARKESPMNAITAKTLAAMAAIAAAASGMNPPGASELDRETAGKVAAPVHGVARGGPGTLTLSGSEPAAARGGHDKWIELQSMQVAGTAASKSSAAAPKGDRLGNFEIQDLMSTYNQAPSPMPGAAKADPSATAPAGPSPTAPPGTGKTMAAEVVANDSRPGVGILKSTDGGKTWYFGSANGGVWKTTDGGASWLPVQPQRPNAAPSIDVENKKLERMIDRRPPSTPQGAQAGTGASGRIGGIAVDPAPAATPKAQLKAPTAPKPLLVPAIMKVREAPRSSSSPPATSGRTVSGRGTSRGGRR
jgi:hypothetical protein